MIANTSCARLRSTIDGEYRMCSKKLEQIRVSKLHLTYKKLSELPRKRPQWVLKVVVEPYVNNDINPPALNYLVPKEVVTPEELKEWRTATAI